MATFEVSAHMKVRPGQLEGFKKQAAELLRPSQPLTDLLKAHAAGFTWFTFVQGLESSLGHETANVRR